MNANIHQRQPAPRGLPRGFTLVELLVVMVILAILASMVLMALSNTQTSARDARTRATITKLDTLIMAKWETYQTRRVTLKNISGNTDRRSYAKRRLEAIRETMRLELPDQIKDFDTATPLATLSARPAVSNAYYKRYNASTKDPKWDGAECLYLIVAYGLNDPDALSQFNESEIGDFDRDGLPEFMDGWGTPITFIRWAPAYVYEINNPSANPLGSDPTNFVAPSSLIIRDPVKHHDPFDPMNIDPKEYPGKPTPRGYALYPLIISAGPDKVYGIQDTRTSYDDPYANAIGKPLGDGSECLDNITNHQIQDY